MSIWMLLFMPAALTPVFDEWTSCAKSEAVRLEASRESADIVADAAMRRCDKYARSFFDRLESDFVALTGEKTPPAQRAKFERDISAMVREEAVLVVVERRAAAKP